jgi:hypothetical protein
MPSLVKIISGGQTGADRGGLDAAIELRIEHGGWCPYGRRADDGKIPFKYQLRELTSSDYPSRTRTNIEESDGTIVFVIGPVTPGSRLTLALCKEMDKPHLVLRLNEGAYFLARRLRFWLTQNAIRVLNVAGSRELYSPGIQQGVCSVVKLALQDGVQGGTYEYDDANWEYEDEPNQQVRQPSKSKDTSCCQEKLSFQEQAQSANTAAPPSNWGFTSPKQGST